MILLGLSNNISMNFVFSIENSIKTLQLKMKFKKPAKKAFFKTLDLYIRFDA